MSAIKVTSGPKSLTVKNTETNETFSIVLTEKGFEFQQNLSKGHSKSSQLLFEIKKALISFKNKKVSYERRFASIKKGMAEGKSVRGLLKNLQTSLNQEESMVVAEA